jgi:sporulation protein YlmC with PRC-barrel domain
MLLASAALLVSSSMALAQDDAATAEETTPDAESSASMDAQASGEVIALPDWHPDISSETAVSVEQLLDFDVYGPTGEEIGEIENVLMGTEGEVLSVIAEVGGLLEIGDTHVNVPWDEVEVNAAEESVTVPVTQEEAEDYTLFIDEVVAAGAAASDIQQVSGDNAGLVETGPRVWQARELIGDYVRLRDGDAFENYGFIDDILIRDGQIEAVVVRPDVTWGTPGLYAYPYYGYGYGWAPGSPYYDLPYARADVEALEPLDEEVWDD